MYARLSRNAELHVHLFEVHDCLEITLPARSGIRAISLIVIPSAVSFKEAVFFVERKPAIKNMMQRRTKISL